MTTRSSINLTNERGILWQGVVNPLLELEQEMETDDWEYIS